MEKSDKTMSIPKLNVQSMPKIQPPSNRQRRFTDTVIKIPPFQKAQNQIFVGTPPTQVKHQQPVKNYDDMVVTQISDQQSSRERLRHLVQESQNRKTLNWHAVID